MSDGKEWVEAVECGGSTGAISNKKFFLMQNFQYCPFCENYGKLGWRFFRYEDQIYVTRNPMWKINVYTECCGVTVNFPARSSCDDVYESLTGRLEPFRYKDPKNNVFCSDSKMEF